MIEVVQALKNATAQNAWLTSACLKSSTDFVILMSPALFMNPIHSFRSSRFAL